MEVLTHTRPDINPLLLPKLGELPRYTPRLISPPDFGNQKINPAQYDWDERWATFMQGRIIQPWVSDKGERIQNVVLGSLAMPPGTQHLIGEIMLEARQKSVPGTAGMMLSFNDSDNLLAGEENLIQTEADDGVLNIFGNLMDAAEEVIRRRYPTLEYDAVTEFFHYQKLRRDNLEKLKADTKAFLFSGDCKNSTAWGSEYGGFFVMKFTVHEDGVTKGTDPNGNEDNVDGHITAGNLGHEELMDWMAGHNAEDPRRVRLGWIADSTVWVEHCGGCKSFFEQKMEHVITKVKSGISIFREKLGLHPGGVIGGFGGSLDVALVGADSAENVCSTCNEKKDSDHNCSPQGKKINFK